MSIEEFTSCVSNRISAQADELTKVAEDAWKQLLNWWRPLTPEMKSFLDWLAAQNAQKFFASVGAVLQGLEVTATDALANVVSGASLDALIESALACEDQLSS